MKPNLSIIIKILKSAISVYTSEFYPNLHRDASLRLLHLPITNRHEAVGVITCCFVLDIYRMYWMWWCPTLQNALSVFPSIHSCHRPHNLIFSPRWFLSCFFFTILDTSQPASQPASQPEPTIQPANQPKSQPANQPASQPARPNHPSSQPASQPISLPVCCLPACLPCLLLHMKLNLSIIIII